MKLQINFVTEDNLGEGKEIEECDQEIISAITMTQDPSGVREHTNFPGWKIFILILLHPWDSELDPGHQPCLSRRSETMNNISFTPDVPLDLDLGREGEGSSPTL